MVSPVRCTIGRLLLLSILFVLAARPQVFAASHNIALYQVGGTSPAVMDMVKQGLEQKGYGVVIVPGETVIEKHLEKINRINRAGYELLIALQVLQADRTRVLVAQTDEKKSEAKLLEVDQMPGQFAAESGRLAGSIASALKTKAKHMPLFPLIGVAMPGVFVRAEGKEEEAKAFSDALSAGIDKYFEKGTMNEK